MLDARHCPRREFEYLIDGTPYLHLASCKGGCFCVFTHNSSENFMPLHSTTIDGLTFNLFKLYDVWLPDESMIKAVLADRHTDDAKRGFCETSNYYCSIFEGQISNELPPDTPENKLTIDRIKLDRQFMGTKLSMSVTVGYSFQKLIISQYVTSWYQAVIGNFSGGNPQSIRKGNTPIDVDKETGEMETIDLSIKYLNFKQAVDYISGFYDTISSLYGEGNVEVINLSDKQDDIIKRIASLEEKVRKQYPKEFIFFCKYCQSYHTYDSFKVRKTCGSKDCIREYSKKTSSTHRSNPATIATIRLTCFYCRQKRKVFVRSSDPAHRFCESCSFKHEELDAIEFWSK